MLPNMRLSGTANDPLGDFLAVSSASLARSAANAASVAAANSSAAAASFAAASRSFATSVSSSAWGPLPVSTSSGSASFASTVGSGPQSSKLLNNYKESTGWSRPETSATSMPWAAAVKAPIEHHHHHHHHNNNLQQQQHVLLQQQQQQHPVALAAAAASLASVNAFGDSNNTMGSWTSPETSSSTRSGWNADGSMKSDGTPDDGTSIWGNPTTKKTGIDWTEKESLLNPPQNNNSSEKRTQKSESIISSINGTEAWGAPALGNGAGASSNNINSNRGTSDDNNQSNNNNSQQLAKLIENSGNNFVGKLSTINNEPLSWGESSSLQKLTKNGNSSPPSDSVWNYLTSNNNANVKRKTSTDWLSSAGVSAGNSQNCIDELNKQLEATSLFNGGTPSVASIMTKNSSSSIGNNPNLDNNGRQSSLLGGANSAGTIGTSLIGSGIGGVTSNAINDLKQMSANYSAPGDLIELSSSSSPMRQPQVNMLSPNNQTQSQLGAYSLGVTPSRELLKQMVHQIQLAVQAGHLNAHILNQPLSTPTLQLVYTLLQQIKLLQQYQEIQQRAQTVNKSSDIGYNVAQPNNLELQITRVQQNISLLQKAITQQQAALTENDSLVESNLKQQQQQAAKPSTYHDSYANISKNDFTKQQTFTNSIMGDWSRPSVNEQSNQYNNTLLSESSSAAKAWRGVLSSESRDNNAWLLGPTSSKAPGVRPAPPPGLISNLGPSFGNSSVNEISSILDSDGNKQASNPETQPMKSRESSSSLWSGAWFE